MRKLIFYSLNLLILCCPFLSQAQTLPPINSAQIKVDGRTENLRQAGIKQGLKATLIKISGNSEINSVPGIQDLLQHSQDYVKSYHYFNRQENNQNQLYLDITFDKKILIQKLSQANQAIWPDNRPLTLIWINTDSTQPSNILAASDNSQIETTIEKTATARGIAIVFPIMDLQDQDQIDPLNHHVNAETANSLLNRYHADAILVGHFTQADGQWQAQWQFLFHNQPTNWMNTNNSDNLVSADGINQMADMYANQLAIYKNKNLENHFLIAVNNINNLSQYTQAVKSIEQNPAIDNVSVKDMGVSSIKLTITTATDLNNLAQLLTTNAHFTTANATPNVDITLEYHAQTTTPQSTDTKNTATPSQA